MSEFFRAATKCDVAAANKAPMYINRVGILEEDFKHQQLIDEVLKTKLVLEEVDKTFRVSSAGDETAHYSTAPTYSPPGRIATSVDPALRQIGATALKRRVEQRVHESEVAIAKHFAELKDLEKVEVNQQKLRMSKNREQIERALSTAATAAAIRKQEEDEKRRSIEEAEEARRSRRHPIDVFQARVAEDVLADVEASDRIAQAHLRLSQDKLDDFLDKEKQAKLHYSPGHRKHVPAAW